MKRGFTFFWRKALAVSFSLCLLETFLTGCSGREQDGEDLVITEQEKEKEKFNLVIASVDDVVKTKDLVCTYQQTKEQEISFLVSGRRVTKVHVEVGDNVQKGQLLAELSGSGMDERIERLQYQIERNKLLLSFVDDNENNENSRRWLQILNRENMSEEDWDAFHLALDAMHESFRIQREDYQDAIDLDTAELNKLLQEKSVGYVYADMDGVVSWEKQNLEGSTCTRDEVVMRVIDSSDCVFVVKGSEYAALFTSDIPVELNITSGNGAGKYQVVPFEMEKWEEDLKFMLTSEYGDSIIEVGATGYMRVILGEKEQVLSVPIEAVHKADDKAFVYVLGDGDMREVRWVETGLFGDNLVEVTSGLKEGEKVIVK